jgi:hypothetical protein
MCSLHRGVVDEYVELAEFRDRAIHDELAVRFVDAGVRIRAAFTVGLPLPLQEYVPTSGLGFAASVASGGPFRRSNWGRLRTSACFVGHGQSSSGCHVARAMQCATPYARSVTVKGFHLAGGCCPDGWIGRKHNRRRRNRVAIIVPTRRGWPLDRAVRSWITCLVGTF